MKNSLHGLTILQGGKSGRPMTPNPDAKAKVWVIKNVEDIISAVADGITNEELSKCLGLTQ